MSRNEMQRPGSKETRTVSLLGRVLPMPCILSEAKYTPPLIFTLLNGLYAEHEAKQTVSSPWM